MQTNVIRQVTIKAQASGVASAAAELNRLSAAQDGVTVASDRAERRTLSVERAYERLQRQLDAGYRATKQFEAAQRDLDRAMDQGLIDQQRYGQLIDLAAERQARAATASHAMATAQVSSANGVKLNAGQVQNLSFQLNDMAVMLASGQNPFVMMMQQGMQMAQVFGPGVGVGAALKATGSALVGFLTNPLTLAVVAIAAASGAVSLLWGAVSDSDDADTALEKHKELIDRIRDAYGDAGKAATEYKNASLEALRLQNDTTEAVERATRKLAKEMEGMRRQILAETFVEQTGGVPLDAYGKLTQSALDFAAAVEAGNADLEGFILQWEKIRKESPDGELVTAAKALLDMASGAEKAFQRLQELSGGMDVIAASARKIDGSVKATIERMNNQKWFDEQTKLREEAEKAAQKAAEEAAAAAKQQADAIAGVKDQLAFEAEQLSRSAREQAIWNQLKAAGVERTSAEGQEIAALAGRLYDLETAQKAATDAQKEAERATKALVDARAKLAGDLAFERGTMFLSEEDVQIAQRLRDLYGDDIAAALGSAEAEAIRFNNRLEEAAAVGEAMRESLSGAIADVFTGGAKTAGEFLDSLTKGIAKAAADLLASRLTDKLFGGALAPVDAAGTRVATALTGAASRVTAATPPLATAATSLSGAAGDLKQAATALSLSGGAIGAPAAPGAGLSAGVGVGGAALSAANFNLQAAAAAIKTIESLGSGGYGALGKVIANGDRAYGAYQVMGNNIASWTKAAIGYSMTNEAFLRSAEAQDKVFAHRFGLLVQQFGNVSDAASAWFTGRPLATGGASTDINGMSGNAYVDRFNKLYAHGAPTVAAPANDNVASVNIASVGGKTVADAADIGGLSSSSGVGGALTKLGGVLSSPTFQQGLAGFSMGFQSQSPVMGGLGGAFSGLMAGGPVGALVGGAAGILGGILGKSRAEREAEEKAREAWAAMTEEVAAFSDELRGKVTGDLGDAIASAEARFAKYRQAAKEAGEGTGSLARDLEAFTKRITREFKRSFDLQVEAYASGLGSDDPALKASQSMRALRDELLGFVADARIAGGGRAKEARIASRGYVLDQIGGGAGGSTTAYDAYLAEEARIAGTRKEAIALLVELGVKEKKARQQVNAAIADALADAQRVYQEAVDDRRMGFADRLFAATTDLTTLEGQLAQFDREAQREREREIADGGEAMADLERALAAERLKIQTDYQKQSVEAAKRAADELNRTALSIVEYVNGLRAGADSPLSPADRLAAARAAYDSQIGLAQGGNLEALGSITKYADDLLSAARDFYASSEAFQDLFDAVTGQLLGLPAVQGSSDPVVQALYQVNQTLGGLLTADQIATLGLSKDVTVGGLLKASQLVPAGLATNATLGTLLTQAQLQAAGLSRDTTVGGLLTASQLVQAGLARDATVTGVVKTGDVSALGQLPGINSAVNAVNSGVAGVATGVGDVKNGVTDEGGVAKWAKVSAKGVVPYIQPMLFRLTEHSIMLSKLKDVEKAGVKYATGAGSNSLGKKPTAISLNNKVANVELGGSMAIGGIVGRYAPGGIVGNGAWNMDSVRARYAGGGDILLAGGEGVINAAATSMIGPSVIDLINRTGRLPDNDNGRYFDTQNRVLMAGFRALIETLQGEIEMLRAEVRRSGDSTARAIERKPVAKVAARRG